MRTKRVSKTGDIYKPLYMYTFVLCYDVDKHLRTIMGKHFTHVSIYVPLAYVGRIRRGRVILSLSLLILIVWMNVVYACPLVGELDVYRVGVLLHIAEGHRIANNKRLSFDFLLFKTRYLIVVLVNMHKRGITL